jgi:hypothetical protein
VTPSIAIASCAALLPDGDAGDYPLLKALATRRVDVSVVAWSDREVDWHRFDLTVVRSTWDYTTRRAEFLQWLPTVPNLHNPAAVLAANSDKRYLRALIEAGLPVVETRFFEPGQTVAVPEHGQFVVKPSVGAGSRGAGRFDADQTGEADRAAGHAAQLHRAGRTVVVQPYLSGVDSHGETALIYLDGVFSHSIRKSAMLAAGDAFAVDAPGLWIEEAISARTPSAAELEVGGRILSHLTPDGPLLYARIDLLPSPSGPVLVEAELTEPSLFLDEHPPAADRLADAILSRLG